MCLFVRRAKRQPKIHDSALYLKTWAKCTSRSDASLKCFNEWHMEPSEKQSFFALQQESCSNYPINSLVDWQKISKNNHQLLNHLCTFSKIVNAQHLSFQSTFFPQGSFTHLHINPFLCLNPFNYTHTHVNGCILEACTRILQHIRLNETEIEPPRFHLAETCSNDKYAVFLSYGNRDLEK